MGQVFSNMAAGELAAGIIGTDTTCTLVAGQTAFFPTIPSGDWAVAVIQSGDAYEVVHITGKSGNNLTITRAREGTAAQNFPLGSTVELRVTAGVLGNYEDRITALEDGENAAIATKVSKEGDTLTGSLLMPNGSAAAPAISFSSDPNTGIFRPSSDVLCLATNGTERMRVSVGGGVFIGTTLTSPNPGMHFSPAGGASFGNNNGSQDFVWAGFLRNGAYLGGISQVGTSGVIYGSNSDYRLKEPLRPSDKERGAVSVRSMLVRDYLWRDDVQAGAQIGFFAHELQEHAPEAVTGEKDALNEDGSIKPQNVDHSRLVPRLVLALQHALDEIDVLKARVAALEAR